MAIDKAIDSAVLDANLTTVADAIRAKGGTSDALSFPTGFADAISAIQAGGGGGSVKIATGTLVPTSSTVYIDHGLGETPNLFFWFVTDFTQHTTTEQQGGYYVTASSNSNTLCGGHIKGVSFLVKATGSSSASFRYLVWPTNQDNFGRYIYKFSDTRIISNTSDLASGNVGETVRWVAAVI